MYGTEQYRGSFAVRREFNKIITAYAEVSASRSDASTIYANTVGSFVLDANAPNNPFTGRISVALPGGGNDVRIRSSASTMRTLGGFIANLPGDWQAVGELSYSTSSYRGDNRPATVTQASLAGLQTGANDAFRDVSTLPLVLAYDAVPYASFAEAGRSSTLSTSLRVAGKLPFWLPGGKPQITLNSEINRARVDSVQTANATNNGARTTFTPAAGQTTKSLYGEIAFPIFGPTNSVFLIDKLEFRVSARHEAFVGDGANPYSCFGSVGQTADQLIADCPPSGIILPRSKIRNGHTDPSISMLWSPIASATFRGSYTTGYLPPSLPQLVRIPVTSLLIMATDPERGNEPIGESFFGLNSVTGFVGGNSEVRPESSRTFSAGIILTPAAVNGLRFSADWTRIRKKDIYFNPLLLGLPFSNSQGSFEEFLRANPDRAIRAPASDGFAVGKITSLDLSLVNLNSLKTDAYDFTLNYDTVALGGFLSLSGRATYVDSLAIQAFGDDPEIDYAGVVATQFASTGGGSGALRWRGNVSAQWSRDALTVGWQARYLDGYYLNTGRTVDLNQGSARVASQTYHDLNLTYRFPFNATLRFGINNVLNKRPPFDATSEPLYYSPYSDPRLRSFYLGMTKSF